MTGQELHDYIIRAFKRDDKTTEVYEAITDVIIDIKSKYYFEDFKVEYYATLSTLGDFKLALPDDFGHLLGDVVLQEASNTYGRTLQKHSKEVFDQMYPNQYASNVVKAMPRDYCVYGGNIYLGPVPDDITHTYQINYSTEAETAIVAGTTSVPFSDRYRKMLRELVLAELYFGIGNTEEAITYKQLGESSLAVMISNDNYNVQSTLFTQYSGT